MRSEKKKKDYLRAQDLVLRDNFDFNKDYFCKELNAFLSNRLVFDSLTVEVVEGAERNVIICVNVFDVKKSRVL